MLSYFQGFLFIRVFPSFKSRPPLLCTVIVLVSPQTSAQGKDGVTHLGVTGTLRGFRQLADMPILHLICEREAGGSDGPGDTCTPWGIQWGTVPKQTFGSEKTLRPPSHSLSLL